MECTLENGQKGYKWGQSGKCYPNRADALKQARAIQSSQGVFKDYKVAEDSKINDWIEIAKVGKFPQGDLTPELFDELVGTFNPEIHEPPHTLGHIREDHNDKPAFGWIAGLKRVGNTLLAKSQQISDKLDNFVREGLFKKRSIGIRYNSDGKPFLHHLAWLGSSVPAVKGLANVYDDARFMYSDEGADNQKEFESEINNPVKPSKKEKKMELTEKELQEKIDNAKAEGAKDAEKDFSEKLKTETEKAKNDGKAEAEKEFNEKSEADKAKNAYRSNCDALIKEFAEGEKIKLVPAQVAPLRELLYSFGENKAVEYSEKDKNGNEKTVKTDALKLVREVISNFKEVSKEELPKTEKGAKGEDAQYEEEKAEAEKIQKEFKDKGETITFGQALIKARANLKRNEK